MRVYSGGWYVGSSMTATAFNWYGVYATSNPADASGWYTVVNSAWKEQPNVTAFCVYPTTAPTPLPSLSQLPTSSAPTTSVPTTSSPSSTPQPTVVPTPSPTAQKACDYIYFGGATDDDGNMNQDKFGTYTYEGLDGDGVPYFLHESSSNYMYKRCSACDSWVIGPTLGYQYIDEG